MAISKDLLLAILSMDSYNQGYGRGLEHSSTQIGTATLLGLASGVPEGQTTAWTNASFYAAAYDTQYGKVISYRGTDNYGTGYDPVSGGSDLWNGWLIGGGYASNSLHGLYPAATVDRRLAGLCYRSVAAR